MNLRQYLQKFIQGWLPNQHPVVLAKKMSKPIWWKPFWSIAWIYTEILGIVGFLVLRIPIWYVGIIGGYLGIIGVSAAFYSVIKHSSMNRATYILVGMTTLGLLLSVTYTFMLGHYTIAWLSGWFNLIIIVGIQIAGGVVGGLIGKQRDYQTLPIGFDDIAQTSRMSDRDKAVKLKVVSVLLGVLGVLVGWSAAGYASKSR